MPRVWAIARVTLLQIMRRLSALVVVLFLGASTVFLGLYVEGDQTLTGQLKVLLRWSQSFISAGLMFLTVYLSATSLSSEFRNKQIFMLDVKPVPRPQILLGKWLGVAAVVLWLQLLLSVLIFVTMNLVVLSASQETLNKTTEAKIFDLDRAHREVFVSRQSVKPTIVNFDWQIRSRLQQLLNSGAITKTEAQSPELREWIKQGINLKLMSLNPGDSQELKFENIVKPTDPASDFVVRYRFYGRSSTKDVKFLTHQWTFSHNQTGQSWHQKARSRDGQWAEFVQHSKAIGNDGSLTLTVKNLAPVNPNDRTAGLQLMIPALDGIELLVPTGSFVGNFIRGQLLLSVRLLMLSLIGISLSPSLRSQVVAFALIGLLVAGSLNNFVAKASGPEVLSFAEIQQKIRNPEQAQNHKAAMRPAFVIQAALLCLPNFQDTAAVDDWIVGREISWLRVFRQVFLDLVLRGGATFAYGVFSFKTRETGIPVFD